MNENLIACFGSLVLILCGEYLDSVIMPTSTRGFTDTTLAIPIDIIWLEDQ